MASRFENPGENPDHLEVSEANLVATLSHPERRARLRAAMRREQGSHLPLTNRYDDVAARSEIEPDVLRGVANQLLEADCLDLLAPLVFNRSMPDDVLLRLCHEGKCVDVLGHRRLPRAILVRGLYSGG